ncbi:MAG: FixH family protein [Deltaproteobacteria bacterium]|nr:FixH family protein [Deltaproteobacteria bacterium]
MDFTRAPKWPVVLVIAATACGSEDPADEQRCAGASADTYTAGLAKTAEGLEVTFTDATPAPPARGQNVWTVATEGGSIEGLDFKAWMPAHGHGTNPLWTRADAVGNGTYRVGPIDLFMTGLWEITVRAKTSSTTGPAPEVMFTFCLES